MASEVAVAVFIAVFVCPPTPDCNRGFEKPVSIPSLLSASKKRSFHITIHLSLITVVRNGLCGHCYLFFLSFFNICLKSLIFILPFSQF